MIISNYDFSPSFAPSIVVLILFPVLIGLGMWQLDRAEEKRMIEANILQAEKNTPLDLNKANKAQLFEEIYRPVTASGKYDTDHQFLYDNRTYMGKPGYHVLTPLKLAGQEEAVLVNRGWIPFVGRRDNIQDINLVRKGDTIVKGVIKKPSKSILLKKEIQNNKEYPKTIQSIALEAMGKELGYTFLPIVIELDKSEKEGYVRDWQPYYGSIDKHIGYALQWFAMAVVLLLLFIKLSTKKL